VRFGSPSELVMNSPMLEFRDWMAKRRGDAALTTIDSENREPA
jgi:hypothetical protein